MKHRVLIAVLAAAALALFVFFIFLALVFLLRGGRHGPWLAS